MGFIEKNISGGSAWGIVLLNVFILTRGGECCGKPAIFYYVNENVAGGLQYSPAWQRMLSDCGFILPRGRECCLIADLFSRVAENVV